MSHDARETRFPEEELFFVRDFVRQLLDPPEIRRPPRRGPSARPAPVAVEENERAELPPAEDP